MMAPFVIHQYDSNIKYLYSFHLKTTSDLMIQTSINLI